MGIRNLNKYFKNECFNSIKILTMSELSGKKITVDINIYIYKYASEGTLIENIYLMLSIFKHYTIIPIFIFDGKVPEEKKELLLQRKLNKKNAEKEYNQLMQSMNTVNNDNDKQQIKHNMELLKKKFVYINNTQLDNIKKLITFYGMTYIVAPFEADELCSLMVIKEMAWACLSEDMDMFVYGCPRVIRYMSLLKHTVVLYNTIEILKKLNINQNLLLLKIYFY